MMRRKFLKGKMVLSVTQGCSVVRPKTKKDHVLVETEFMKRQTTVNVLGEVIVNLALMSIPGILASNFIDELSWKQEIL